MIYIGMSKGGNLKTARAKRPGDLKTVCYQRAATFLGDLSQHLSAECREHLMRIANPHPAVSADTAGARGAGSSVQR